MKKLLALFAVLPVVATASSFTPTKQSCQSVAKDVITVMSYVAPCGENLEKPAIFEQNAKAKAVIDERLMQCQQAFSSEEEQESMDELVQSMSLDLQDWQYRLTLNQGAFCQAQKAHINRRLSSYVH